MVPSLAVIADQIKLTLSEDIGSGDITAALLPENITVTANIITRESMVVCGMAWVNEVYRQLDPSINLIWHVAEGDECVADTILLTLTGAARSLMSGERCMLNWLQTLSGTATLVRQYVKQLAGTKTQLLDTRKTIPGLRVAQKYAVTVGGGKNHRMGLFDAYLIKENHIQTYGSIQAVVAKARQLNPDKKIEIEVENLKELKQALVAGADIIMLDNFNLADLRPAVKITEGKAKLEVSGNVTLKTIHEIAQTGIDYISVGALTKHLNAIDLSMRIVDE